MTTLVDTIAFARWFTCFTVITVSSDLRLEENHLINLTIPIVTLIVIEGSIKTDGSNTDFKSRTALTNIFYGLIAAILSAHIKS